MRILFIGPELGTAQHRIAALRRLGHDVKVVDTNQAFDKLILPQALILRWTAKTGGLGASGLIKRFALSQLKGEFFDLALVDSGEYYGPAIIREFKKIARVVVNFNQDNPYVPRDGLKWRQFLKALPYYDLAVTPRASSVAPARRAGARRVIAVNFAADEAVHRPIELTDEDRARYAAKVVFVGTWMPERGPFLLRLVERGVPLRIYGDRWMKAPEYERLKPYIASGNLVGDDYVKAIRAPPSQSAFCPRGIRICTRRAASKYRRSERFSARSAPAITSPCTRMARKRSFSTLRTNAPTSA